MTLSLAAQEFEQRKERALWDHILSDFIRNLVDDIKASTGGQR